MHGAFSCACLAASLRGYDGLACYPPGVCRYCYRGKGPRVRGPEKNLDEILKKGLNLMRRKSTQEEDKVANNPQGKWIMASSEVCDFFGISAETLRKWTHKGAPKIGYGKWDLRALVDWKYRSVDSPETRKLRAEADIKEAKASMEAIKLEVARGNYIETALVTKDLRLLFGNIKKSLLGMGHKVATELNSFSPDEALAANNVVDDVVKEALQALSEGRNYGK